MPKTRSQKEQTITELEQAFKKGKSVAFADYQGMKVKAIADLRKTLHGADVKYIVAKKSLLSRAAKVAGFDVDFSLFSGMLGVAFAFGDEMAPAQLIDKAGKDASIKLVGGIFEGKIMDQASIIMLSKLPSRLELIAQVLSVLNGPMSGLARVLNAQREKLATQ